MTFYIKNNFLKMNFPVLSLYYFLSNLYFPISLFEFVYIALSVIESTKCVLNFKEIGSWVFEKLDVLKYDF